MWDAKRQTIWLTTALAIVTFFAYQEAKDDTGRLDFAYFAQLEVVVLIVIAIMFYIYSKQRKQ
jgi:cbb3-type cytochrome oxidase subunit 3